MTAVNLLTGLCGHVRLATYCLIATVAHASVPDADVSAYHEIVSRYRAGNFAEATRQIASWNGKRLLETTDRLRRVADRAPSAPDVTTVAATCLLHLEVLHASERSSLTDHVHRQLAREALKRLRALYPATSLTADVHLAFSLHLQGELRLEDLRLYFEEVGDSFASYAPFQLAKATLYETLASARLEPARRAALVPGANDSLERAERMLRRALDIEPQLAEARLRLAHVVALQARPDEAQRLLEAIVQSPSEPTTRYLAYLFLGRVHLTAGRLPEAEESFAAGHAGCACCQAASVALAHLAFREGRRDAAREIVRSLEHPVGCVDPWVVYDFGQVAKLDGLLMRLRGAIQE